MILFSCKSAALVVGTITGGGDIQILPAVKNKMELLALTGALGYKCSCHLSHSS